MSLFNKMVGGYSDDNMMIPIVKTKRFLTEDPWLTEARSHAIAKDAASSNPRLLVNNPTRAVNLRAPTVLVGMFR